MSGMMPDNCCPMQAGYVDKCCTGDRDGSPATDGHNKLAGLFSPCCVTAPVVAPISVLATLPDGEIRQVQASASIIPALNIVALLLRPPIA